MILQEGEVMVTDTDKGAKMHTVRPRWTWIGLVVMVTGLVLIGIGIVVPSWAWAIVGLFLLGCGGVASEPTLVASSSDGS